MRLAELQRAFQAHVIAGDPAILPAIRARDERGLRVYRNAYRATLGEALRDTFRRTAAWLGDDAFGALADGYVATVRSTSWTLDDYGDRFVATLAEAFPGDPAVAELAWLEWELRRAFGAAATAPVAREALMTADWERARLGFQPAVAARRIAGDVAGLWHALDRTRAPEPEPQRVLLPLTAGLVVWRDGLRPRFRTTDAAEADALAALLSGKTFAAAVATAGNRAIAGGWLARWLADEIITSIG